MVIAEAVFNRLKSTDGRECVRIARLPRSDRDLTRLDKIIWTFAKYCSITCEDPR